MSNNLFFSLPVYLQRRIDAAFDKCAPPAAETAQDTGAGFFAEEEPPLAASQIPLSEVPTALQLLDLFRAQRGRGRSGLPPRLSTTEAEKAFKELMHMRELGSEDAKRWIAAWRASGFLPAAM